MAAFPLLLENLADSNLLQAQDDWVSRSKKQKRTQVAMKKESIRSYCYTTIADEDLKTLLKRKMFTVVLRFYSRWLSISEYTTKVFCHFETF